MKRLLAALALCLALARAAHAATPIWSNTVGGFPTWYGSPSFSSNAYTLSAPLPSAPPFSLVAQQHVRIVVPASGGNTASATLNVNGTGALPIVTNAENGLSALVGGELVPGLEYDLTYSTSSASACSSSCWVMSWLAGSPVLAGTTQTVTASQWAAVSAFEVTSSGQTLTLPASSGLSANGGVLVLPGIAGVTITPGSGDVITYGSVAYAENASVLLPAGTLALVTKPSSGNIAISATSTFAMAVSSSIAASAFGAQ
jgi:hypothetical protein